MREPLMQTTHTRLRALEPQDYQLMYDLENDTTMWDASAATQPYSIHNIRNFIQNSNNDIYKDQRLRLTIVYKEHEKETAVGFADFFDFNARHLRAEIGIGILPKYQKRGIGTEVLRIMHQYATQILLLHQIYAYVSPNNTPSVRLFSSAGYQRVGTIEDWIKTHRDYQPTILFQKIL